MIAILYALTVILTQHPEQTMAKVALNVRDEAGHSLPFRGYVSGSTGNVSYPANVVVFKRKSKSVEECFSATGTVEFVLPPGDYSFRFEKGLEWIPYEEKVALANGDVKSLDIAMKRWVDMNAEGWYSGDMHIHRALNEVESAFLAEDANFGANMAFWNDQDLFAKAGVRRPMPSMKVLDEKHVLCTGAQEIERLGRGWGAMLYIGEFEPLIPPKDPFFPLESTLCEQARAHGALIDFEKPVWKSTSLCAAFGLVDSIGVVHNHFHPHNFLPMKMISDAIVPPPSIEMSPRDCALYTLSLYYHLLNCGLRIAASAGSANGVMPSQIGFERTYVRLDAPFSGQEWLDGLRAGRSFGTNGPILLLSVDGRNVGDVLKLDKETASLHVRCIARSQGPLESIEIINNGVVVATESLSSKASEILFDKSIDLRYGWVAARCFERASETQMYAATSPVYIDFGEKRFVEKASARYYADFIQSLITQAESENRYPIPEQKIEAMAILNKAKAFYEALASSNK